MDLKKYQEETQRTLPDLESEILNSVHMTMGINTELPELFSLLKTISFKPDTSRIIDEGGDVFWYLSNYSTIRGLTFTYPIDPIFAGLGDVKEFIADRAYKLLDIDKKCLVYGKTFDRGWAYAYASGIFSGLTYILGYYQISTEEVFERNINKLRIRFPDKFDANLVLNKDEEKEKEAFK